MGIIFGLNAASLEAECGPTNLSAPPKSPSMLKHRLTSLLSAQTSRRNKIWLLSTYKQDADVEWKWEGQPYESRILIRTQGGCWQRCLSYDEDIRPSLSHR